METEWEDDAAWIGEIHDYDGSDQSFIQMNDDPQTLADLIMMVIRLGGPIRKFGIHRDAMLAPGMPGYYVSTRRLSFNLIPVIDTPVDADDPE